MDVKVIRRDKGAFICSPSPSAYFPPPTPGRAALGLHSPSRRERASGRAGGRAGGRTHQIFLASWVYQKFLPMVLRWRASRAGAPLKRHFELAISLRCNAMQTSSTEDDNKRKWYMKVMKVLVLSSKQSSAKAARTYRIFISRKKKK